MANPFVFVLGVFLLGALVAAGELISRYRDNPRHALISLPGGFYLFLNGLAALVAWELIHIFNWKFISTTDPQAIEWTRLLVAGFGSSALFRTSLFSVRAGGQDIAIGPSTLLQVILRAIDSAVDRKCAAARSKAVVETMRGISFAHAFEALPGFCLALMQNLPKEDQDRLALQVKAIDALGIDDEIKSLLLGLALMNVVGEDVLGEAVKSLRPHITAGAAAAAAAPAIPAGHGGRVP